jgi:hypothetical protein
MCWGAVTVCKPSCCPGTSSSSLGPLAATVAGLVLAAAVAGPVAAAAASLLHALALIAVITASLAGITVVAVTVAIFCRARRSPGYHTPVLARTWQAHPRPSPAVVLPRRTPRFELTEAERARCAALGIDPGQATQIMAAVLGVLPSSASSWPLACPTGQPAAEGGED